MTTLLHLTGSAESAAMADLSVLYAADCLEAAGSAYDHVIAHVTPDGCWRFPESLEPDAIAQAEPIPMSWAVEHLAGTRIDAVLPQMFCRPGMTTYRSLLDLLGIPYVGNTAATMAIGTDKAWARSVVAGAGVDVPDAQLLTPGEEPSMAPPVVVKPVDADNSSGVSLVRRPEEYADALDAAFAHSGRVLVERYVELGREVRCGVLERDGGLVCLPLEEYAVDPDTKPIRPEADKLTRRDGALSLVAKTGEYAWIVQDREPAVEAAAMAAHRALGCRDYSLFDFRIDPEGRPWFLEAGLYCSFARTSVVAMMAEAAGLPLVELLSTCVERAVLRYIPTP